MPLKDGLNISSNDCDLSQTKFTNKTIVNTHERNSVKTNKAKGKEKNTVYRNNVKKNEMKSNQKIILKKKKKSLKIIFKKMKIM